jgi:hypothetical protein
LPAQGAPRSGRGLGQTDVAAKHFHRSPPSVTVDVGDAGPHVHVPWGNEQTRPVAPHIVTLVGAAGDRYAEGQAPVGHAAGHEGVPKLQPEAPQVAMALQASVGSSPYSQTRPFGEHDAPAAGRAVGQASAATGASVASGGALLPASPSGALAASSGEAASRGTPPSSPSTPRRKTDGPHAASTAPAAASPAHP